MRYAETPSFPVQPTGDLLPMERISPRPTIRHAHDAGTLSALAESIRCHGLMRPITVRALHTGRYIIVSGNRRFLACRTLGMTCIPAHILRHDTAWQAPEHLLEALLTHRLHYLEAADALHVLHEVHHMPFEELARLTGSSPQALQAQEKLATLEDELKALLLEEGVPMGLGLLLPRLPAGVSRARAASTIVRDRLCVRDAALLVSAELRGKPIQGRFQASPIRVDKTEFPEGSRQTVKCLIRDHRLYLNAIRDIAGQMQAAGFAAMVTERQLQGQLELLIRVPVRQRRMARHHSS